MTTNKPSFEEFLSTLQETNMTLEHFVDFEKCTNNLKKTSIKLNTLNYLLGKKDLKKEIAVLFNENKSCFEVLNVLIAVRNQNTLVFKDQNSVCELKDYFTSTNAIYVFFFATGLKNLFESGTIKNLNDYVFGVEVGLDTNARKNRGGNNFSNLIHTIFTANSINVNREIQSDSFNDIDFGLDIKRFDFVIKTKKHTYLLETNFYNTGGSKLNEVARSYIELNQKIVKNPKYKFIWLTDGKGWLSAKNKLEEAYKSIEIYNLALLNLFLAKVRNEQLYK